eukprot:gnl/Trimastix_PCT/3254.p1 GENE.gnl/Trimastix_PCT/3254~~gnl/Trimastix_PCT/3254.p1  ORF type:complete len:402 (+),score=125.74 gnl/Trimastix_PCT/3254:255-1460(+)
MVDRVTHAAKIYNELTEAGERVLVIPAGGNKYPSSTSTEASRMRDQALEAGVPAPDIELEDSSTNTAENALYCKQKLEKHGINKVIVLTSDFHLDRSRYVFLYVFGGREGGFGMSFVGAPSSDKLIANRLGSREAGLYASSKKDLEGLKLTLADDSFGYHPFRNRPRWLLIADELLSPEMKHLRHSAVDYGSNMGYFSLKMVPHCGLVISNEGERNDQYEGSINVHRGRLAKMSAELQPRNLICVTTFNETMFDALHEVHVMFDVQLSLSVFHWLNLPTRALFEKALSAHLSNGRVTFLELPEFRHYVGNERQYHWQAVNEWYAGAKDVEEVVERAARKHGLRVAVKRLGANAHENGTVRTVLRVDLLDLPGSDSWDDYTVPAGPNDPSVALVKSIFACKS